MFITTAVKFGIVQMMTEWIIEKLVDNIKNTFNKDGNNGQGLKTFRVNRPSMLLFMHCWRVSVPIAEFTKKLVSSPNALIANSTLLLLKPISIICATMGWGGGGDGFSFLGFWSLAPVFCGSAGGGMYATIALGSAGCSGSTSSSSSSGGGPDRSPSAVRCWLTARAAAYRINSYFQIKIPNLSDLK